MADREKVVEHLYDCLAASRPGALWVFARKAIVGDAIALLKEQPEIVRCKECKHCEYPDFEKEWCKKGHLHGNAETWFCADGERRC